MSADATADAGALRPWHFFVVCAMLGAAVAVFLARNNSPENLVLLSLTVLAAGFAGLAFHRTVWPLVSAEAEADTMPLGSRARIALEREKMLVLRSIKELEFDRAMGKVADADFDDMSGRLRERAIRLMQQLDDDRAGYRDAIERDIAQRLGTRGKAGAAGARGAGATRPRGDGARASGPSREPADAVSAVACGECGTQNDPDARFCKSCGSRFEKQHTS
jgi:hypothetical protein